RHHRLLHHEHDQARRRARAARGWHRRARGRDPAYRGREAEGPPEAGAGRGLAGGAAGRRVHAPVLARAPPQTDEAWQDWDRLDAWNEAEPRDDRHKTTDDSSGRPAGGGPRNPRSIERLLLR